MDEAKKRNPDIVLMVRLSKVLLTHPRMSTLVFCSHIESAFICITRGNMHAGRFPSACTCMSWQALSWGVPGWIGNGTEFWSEDNIDYHVRFARGLKQHHGHQVHACPPVGGCVLFFRVMNFLFPRHWELL